MKKKGALELSMNTIVIIVIGVIVLTLGIVFVRNMMDDAFDITKDAFDNAKSEVNKKIGEVDSLVTVAPHDIDIKRGKAGLVGIIFYNNDVGDSVKQVTATVVPEDINSGVNCYFDQHIEGNRRVSKTYDLTSGEKRDIYLIAEVGKDAGLGIAICNVDVNSGEADDSLIIDKT